MTLSGDVSASLDAPGSPADHPEALGRAIGLVGPDLEIEAFDRHLADHRHGSRRQRALTTPRLRARDRQICAAGTAHSMAHRMRRP
ncbi:hypothetical protein [Agrococcus sp. GCM10030264]|uniref:hypothetical protein n=1 Tax=Agrococcus sp. GCM10030264 TaxID=3273377 RepID=UPI003614526F